MTIDHLPSIRAFCVERIKSIKAIETAVSGPHDRIEELELIITLCDGLEAQTKLLKNALGL